jgi:thiol-disulfide isomerase/thioredoxin
MHSEASIDLSLSRPQANAKFRSIVNLIPALIVTLCLVIFSPDTLASGAGTFSQALAGKLVKLDPASGEVRPYQIPDPTHPRYFMIYFSAHWCAPCRKMTPSLVEFYNETKSSHPEFEFIFVSADRDQSAMHDYLRWARMPWPALAWQQRSSIPEIVSIQPRLGIPYLAMLGEDGRLHGASEMGGFNVGIPKLINGLQEKIGSEIYDIRERHGQRQPLLYAIYAIAGALALFYLHRKILPSRKT